MLAYDGDCGFCAYWVRYWQRLTGERVCCAPYQKIIADHPAVRTEAFARAIQLFEPDGTRYSAAEAAFRVLARVPGRGAGLWLYRRPHPAPGRAATSVAAVLGVTLVVTSLAQAWGRLEGKAPPEPLATIAAAASRFGVSNQYGFFAAMNTTRREIIVEGSMDGEHWRPYEFRYKTGNVHRCPRWSIPHQPRLDWEMWFAAGEPAAKDPWVGDLLHQLLEGSPPVLDLLASNPFPDHPPTYVRAMLYRDRFTTLEERAETGDCWVRTLLHPYTPPLRIDSWVLP